MRILVKKLLWILFLTLAIISCKRDLENISLKSPDTAYTFSLDARENLSYCVSWKGHSIIEKSELGFILSDGSVLFDSLEMDHVEKFAKNSDWQPVYGERNVYSDHYNEVLVQLSCETFNGRLAL